MADPRPSYREGVRHQVTDADTAAALGSGDVPVLATPRLVAWMEAATVRSAAHLLGEGETSVGTAIRIEHHRATRVGGSVDVAADPPAVSDGRFLTFVVRATDETGELVGSGEIDRVIVDRGRFLRPAPERDT